jgi:hypothetical protein
MPTLDGLSCSVQYLRTIFTAVSTASLPPDVRKTRGSSSGARPAMRSVRRNVGSVANRPKFEYAARTRS